MSAVEGKLDSAGALDGSYLNWVCEFIPMEISLAASGLTTALEDPGANKLEAPRITAELQDTESFKTTQLPDVAALSISRNSEAAEDTYSLTLVDAAKYSPRGTTYPSMFYAGHVKRAVAINLVLSVGGVEYTTRLFTGTVARWRATYGRAETTINVDGSNLSERLRVADGTITNYRGSLFRLIQELLRKTGIDYFYLAIQDELVSTAQSFIALTAQATLDRVFSAMPGIDYGLDHTGTFIARGSIDSAAAPTWILDTRKSISILQETQDATRIETSVNVTGNTAASSLTATDTALTPIYGIRQGSLSNTTLETAEQATNAARDQIAETLRDSKDVLITMATINPFLVPGESATITDPAVSASGAGSGLNGLRFVIRTTSLGWRRSEPSGTLTLGGPVFTDAEWQAELDRVARKVAVVVVGLKRWRIIANAHPRPPGFDHHRVSFSSDADYLEWSITVDPVRRSRTSWSGKADYDDWKAAVDEAILDPAYLAYMAELHP